MIQAASSAGFRVVPPSVYASCGVRSLSDEWGRRRTAARSRATTFPSSPRGKRDSIQSTRCEPLWTPPVPSGRCSRRRFLGGALLERMMHLVNVSEGGRVCQLHQECPQPRPPGQHRAGPVGPAAWACGCSPGKARRSTPPRRPAASCSASSRRWPSSSGSWTQPLSAAALQAAVNAEAQSRRQRIQPVNGRRVACGGAGSG